MERCVYGQGGETLDENLMVNIGGVKTTRLCLFCQGYMKRNKMPSTCHMNKLEIKDVEELLRLQQLVHCKIGMCNYKE